MLHLLWLQGKVLGEGEVCLGRDELTRESWRELSLWKAGRGGDGKMWLVVGSRWIDWSWTLFGPVYRNSTAAPSYCPYVLFKVSSVGVMVATTHPTLERIDFKLCAKACVESVSNKIKGSITVVFQAPLKQLRSENV